MLADNCKEFKIDNNSKVIGVKLGITPVPGARYEVYNVELIDENHSQNNTTANCKVLNKDNVDVGTVVTMGFPGVGPTFANGLLPGNPNNQHIITNGYNPPSIGPLSLFVGPKEAPISDIVYGLGLPFNRHVSYTVIFREKGAIVTPPDPTDPPSTDWEKRLAKVEKWQADVTRFFAEEVT